MIRTKRWNNPVDPDDGLRLLITRYRPRGVRREDATWDDWWKDLAPSKELHADWYGKRGRRISIAEFEERYLKEMQGEAARSALAVLTEMHLAGKTITLLCYCADEQCCHRTLVKRLVETSAERGAQVAGMPATR